MRRMPPLNRRRAANNRQCRCRCCCWCRRGRRGGRRERVCLINKRKARRRCRVCAPVCAAGSGPRHGGGPLVCITDLCAADRAARGAHTAEPMAAPWTLRYSGLYLRGLRGDGWPVGGCGMHCCCCRCCCCCGCCCCCCCCCGWTECWEKAMRRLGARRGDCNGGHRRPSRSTCRLDAGGNATRTSSYCSSPSAISTGRSKRVEKLGKNTVTRPQLLLT